MDRLLPPVASSAAQEIQAKWGCHVYVGMCLHLQVCNILNIHKYIYIHIYFMSCFLPIDSYCRYCICFVDRSYVLYRMCSVL